MNKTELWDRLGRTDPKHTKSFRRAGGFSGTAIKPIYSYRRMTEEYGPCGIGWGIGEPSFQVVPGPEGEVLVYCTVSIWHGDRANIVFGVGGDKAVGKNKYGLSADDEAFKKAFTDAVTNALKLIGVGADVHMGLFDDNKYVSDMKAEFAGQDTVTGEVMPEDVIGRDDNVPVLTRDVQRPIFSELAKELAKNETVEQHKRWKITARSRASRLSDDWKDELNVLYLDRLRELEKRDAVEYKERMAG